MKKGQLVSALILAPCVVVSGFQQVVGITTKRRLDVGFKLESTMPEVFAQTERTTERGSKTEKIVYTSLPPVIQGIVDEEANFKMKLGNAMDVLKRDYANIVFKAPDFSIYHDRITVIDPSGVRLSGLKSYKAAFKFLHAVTNFLYCDQTSGVQLRMCYDFCRSSVRISWHVRLVPKFVGKPLYVDGISTYRMDGLGMVDEHKIEFVCINDVPVKPPYGIMSMLLQEENATVKRRQPVPVGVPLGAWGTVRRMVP